MQKSLILIVAALINLSGCALLDGKALVPEVKPVSIVTVEKPAPIFQPILPSPLTMLPVSWRVLTPDVMEEYVKDLKAGEAPTNVYYSLTVKNYEHLSTNMSDIKRYLRQILNIVSYYEKITGPEEEEKEDESEISETTD